MDDDDEDDLLGDAMHNILEVLQRNVEAQRSRYKKKGRGRRGAIATATIERKMSQEQRKRRGGDVRAKEDGKCERRSMRENK